METKKETGKYRIRKERGDRKKGIYRQGDRDTDGDGLVYMEMREIRTQIQGRGDRLTDGKINKRRPLHLASPENRMHPHAHTHVYVHGHEHTHTHFLIHQHTHT